MFGGSHPDRAICSGGLAKPEPASATEDIVSKSPGHHPPSPCPCVETVYVAKHAEASNDLHFISQSNQADYMMNTKYSNVQPLSSNPAAI